ncbi:MAG TPA: radical SAM protein [Novimethylophilus sp.]|uniref:radical SAM/SPASM domain-containing protein n=1 Tax=Novimethylophilus sp. TaxID=2137426 RepID=UPI002F40FE6C
MDHITHGPIIGNRVELQLYTTLRCNLKCSYCSEAVGDVVNSQGKVSYTLDALDAFIRSQLADKEIYITFYGGEPTLNIPYMSEVTQRWPNFRYQLQTNGTLLNRLPDAILEKLSNTLVSIDGGEATTDGYRGRGVFRKVGKNLERMRGKVQGTLTARVTWHAGTTSFEELDGLLDTFDYVYFQFAQSDDVYDAESMARKQAVLTQMIDRFFAQTDRAYPMIPIMGVVRNKVLPNRAIEAASGYAQCRASTHILNVLPDGRIYPCPDMTYDDAMQHGDINGNWLTRSPLQPTPDMPCETCAAFAFCRRNCMKNLHRAYVENDLHYRTKVVEPVCELVQFIGREIDRRDPAAWYARASLRARKEVADCEVYDYVEVMP